MVRIPRYQIRARVVVGHHLALFAAVYFRYVQPGIEFISQMLGSEFDDRVTAPRIAILKRLARIIKRRFVDRQTVRAEKRTQKIPRRKLAQCVGAHRSARQFHGHGLPAEVLSQRPVGIGFRTRDHENAFG